MDEPDADRQLPPVAIPFQPTGPKYLHLLTIVLPEPPDAVVEYAPGLHERLAYQRRKAVYQHAGDEGRKDQDGVSLEGADARRESVVIKPVRVRLRRVKEEFAQQLRGVPHTVSILIHPGAKDPVDLLLRQRRQFFHHRVHDRISDLGVSDVVVRGLFVDQTGLRITRRIISRYYQGV